MRHSVGRILSVEMALLGACELALSFMVIYAVLTTPDAPAVLWSAPDFGVAGPSGRANLAAVFAVTIALTAAAIGLYRPEICIERRGLLLNAAVAGLLAFPLVLLVSGSLRVGLSRHALLLLSKVLLGWLACVVASRLVFNQVMRERWFVRRVLVLGPTPRVARLSQLPKGGRGRLFDPIFAAEDAGAMALGPPLTVAALRRHNIWGIIVARESGEAGTLPVAQLLDCKLRGVPVFDEATFFEQHLGRIDLDSVQADWLLFADGFARGWLGDAVKRALDVCVSIALLLLTLPLMVLVALLIKLDDPGAVLYRQQRIGLHGRPFTLLKFRSMTQDAEKGGSPRWAQQQDPRITRVGSFIRPLRIDELPQLFNVLHGEMSLVGPRPERPHFVEQLARIIPLYAERSYVKPGLTGWAQVNYPYGASVEDARQKLSYDLYYVKNRSLMLDVLTLLATIRVVLFREGAR